MTASRLEAFSDGVIAIIITIMVLELRPPESSDIAALRPLIPVFLSYLISFIYLAIYWNNHHHLLHATASINGAIMWANIHLLFWLSLVPFVTAWLGEHPGESWPAALYGADMIMAGFAYFILTRTIIAHHGSDSNVARALGNSTKEAVSTILYGVAIALAFVFVWLSYAAFVLVALLWLIPDPRIERAEEKRFFAQQLRPPVTYAV